MHRSCPAGADSDLRLARLQRREAAGVDLLERTAGADRRTAYRHRDQVAERRPMTYFIEQLPDLMRLINEPDGEHAPFDIDAVLDALEYGWQRGPKTIPFDRAHQSRKMKRCLIEVHRFRGIVALPHQLNHSVRDAVDAFE